MPHDRLPTGKPIVGKRREYGHLPTEERLRVGILGLHEGLTMLVALRASQLCHAAAICDIDPTKIAQAEAESPGIQTYTNYSDMLADSSIAIIAIYTPDALHAEQIEAALDAGKHVICTKPLINDISRADRLMRALRSSGCRLQVGQSTRFYEPFQRQRELFELGVFGDCEVYDAHYVHRMDWWYEKSPWTSEQTHWAYLGLSHPVDLVRWYLGSIASVHAVGSKSSLGKKHSMPTPDILSVNLIASDGRIGRVFGHYGVCEHPAGRSLIEGVLYGTKGTSIAKYPELRMTYADETGVEVVEDYEHAMAGYYYRHELKGMHFGEFCNCADYFAAKILAGERNFPDLEEGLETVRVMDSIVRSLESGKPVHL